MMAAIWILLLVLVLPVLIYIFRGVLDPGGPGRDHHQWDRHGNDRPGYWDCG